MKYPACPKCGNKADSRITDATETTTIVSFGCGLGIVEETGEQLGKCQKINAAPLWNVTYTIKAPIASVEKSLRGAAKDTGIKLTKQ